MDLVVQRDKLFYLIGETVVGFQHLESYVSTYLVFELKLRIKDNTFLMIDSMSYKQKVIFLLELVIQHQNDRIKNPKKLKQLLLLAEEYRNKIVHSNWAVDNDKWVRLKGNLRGGNGFVVNKRNYNFEIMEKCNKILYDMQVLESLDDEKLSEFIAAFKDSNTKL